ncbi:rhomboid family serine protease [Labilithrix luteola]|uniref:Rhomboid family serine protease n=1 Tax=Labilithrix luteola TaxID=1391654 RepID=A0A0K1PL09_9BACT|nr:rhomboid family intramembrane serine protease [Labilithrix luteola]AKU94101.1 rhomboid family serine protease [Labilithrix luteola]
MLPVRDDLPTRSPAFVNWMLIGLNVAAFITQVAGEATSHDGSFLDGLALVPANFVAHPLASLPSLFGHMFLHGGLSHIAGNMLFLWIFGDNVEDALGHGRYALFYVSCGLAAAFAQIAGSPHATIPMVGASGAIAGVLAAYGVLYPRSPIRVVNPVPLLWLFWGFFLSLPAWFVIAEFFVANLWNALHANAASGGVAFLAHVGGFLAGYAFLRALQVHQAVEHASWQGVLPNRRDERRAD